MSSRLLRVAPLVLAGCAGAKLPPSVPPPALPPPASPPPAAQAASSPSFTDPQERARKLAEALPEVEALFDEQFAARKPPGMVVALVVDGELRWSKAWGARDLAQGQPAGLDTVFRIASLTKSFTAMSVLRLRDAGKLSLEDPAENYLPELARLRYPTRDSPRITVRHLLSHSAGFPEDNPWSDLHLDLGDDAFEAMLRRGLSFSNAPGTAYEYSNDAFALLGRMVQRVSGQRFPEYLTEQVLRPLGMTASVWKREEVPPQRLALGYGHRAAAPGPELPGGFHEEPQLGPGAHGAASGLYTSIRDLARYAAFQLDAWPPRDDPETGPLSRASRREMQQAARHIGLEIAPGDPLRARARGYGYGFGAHESCDFDRIVSHGGGLPGSGSVLVLLPERGVAFVGATNLTYTAPDPWPALVLLAQKGAIPQRQMRPAPELSQALEAVAGLLQQWDPALAQARFDRTAWYYETPEELKAHLEELRAKLGACRPGQLETENALRGTQTLSCERGTLDAYVTLTPEVPPLIQHLELKPAIPPGARLQKAAERAVALTLRWDDAYARQTFAPSLDPASARKQLTAHGPCQLGAAGPGDGAAHGAFRLTCAKDAQELELTLDEASGRILELKLKAARDPSQKCGRL